MGKLGVGETEVASKFKYQNITPNLLGSTNIFGLNFDIGFWISFSAYRYEPWACSGHGSSPYLVHSTHIWCLLISPGKGDSLSRSVSQRFLNFVSKL